MQRGITQIEKRSDEAIQLVACGFSIGFRGSRAAPQLRPKTVHRTVFQRYARNDGINRRFLRGAKCHGGQRAVIAMTSVSFMSFATQLAVADKTTPINAGNRVMICSDEGNGCHILDALEFMFIDSALKHGIGKDVILGIIADPFLSKTHKSDDAIMVYGFDENGDAVEVIYDAQRRVVFYAMPVNIVKLRKS
jgi:hypothetical protein